MVRTRYNQNWSRRGFALLWDLETLAEIINLDQVISLRQFTNLSKDWPDDLPAFHGDALVVSGFDGCLDVLDAVDAEQWIENDFRDLILSFQEHYEGQAGLIMWLPSGNKRITMKGSSEHYYWKHRGAAPDGFHIGRLLWAGAENEVERILNTDSAGADYDGKNWVGLHHPRIS